MCDFSDPHLQKKYVWKSTKFSRFSLCTKSVSVPFSLYICVAKIAVFFTSECSIKYANDSQQHTYIHVTTTTTTMTRRPERTEAVIYFVGAAFYTFFLAVCRVNGTYVPCVSSTITACVYCSLQFCVCHYPIFSFLTALVHEIFNWYFCYTS